MSGSREIGAFPKKFTKTIGFFFGQVHIRVISWGFVDKNKSIEKGWGHCEVTSFFSVI